MSEVVYPPFSSTIYALFSINICLLLMSAMTMGVCGAIYMDNQQGHISLNVY